MTRKGTLSGISTVLGTTSPCAFVSNFDRVEPAALTSISSDTFSRSANHADRGDVYWVNRSEAQSQRLAYVNEKNQIVMKVDNSSYVPLNEKRNTVRIESRDWYDVGSLWIVDIAHVPYGCSVSLYSAQSVSRSPLISNWGNSRFGPRSGRMVSGYDSHAMSETPSFLCSHTCLQCHCSTRREMAGYWRDRHLR